MKPPPKGWPRLSSSVFYDDAAKAIDWLCQAFGFEVRLKVEGDGGRIEHSELTFGEAVIMVGSSGKKPGMELAPVWASPKSIEGRNTQSLMLYVDDADAHFEQARKGGAVIVDPPKLHDYGSEYWTDKSYGVLDLEGHLWWFCERIRDPEA